MGGGFSPGGFVQGDFVLGGILSWEILSGGFCPGRIITKYNNKMHNSYLPLDHYGPCLFVFFLSPNMLFLAYSYYLTLFPTAFYDFLSYGGGIFIPHPRKQCQNYLIDLKFGTHNQ